MKTLPAFVLSIALFAAAGFAQPTVTQISNAASYSVSPLPNSPIAQGSYFAVFGTGLGSSTPVLWNPYPLPTALGNTSVKVTVGGTTVDAYIELSYSTQVNAVLPSNTPTGTGTLSVTYNGQTQATPTPITVVDRSFGTFTLNQAGTGPGIITDANYVVLNPTHTAKPGQAVILWGTGLGPADATTEQQSPPTQTNLCGSGSNCPVTVWVGGQKASLAYAGRSGFTGEDQIVFNVPTGAQGCYVQVALQIGSITSNFTSMAVDPNGGPCQDADGINYNDLASVLSTNGKAKVGAISLLSNYVLLNILGAPLAFDNDTVNGEIATFTNAQIDGFQGFTIVPSVNNCTVSPFLQYPPPKDPILAQISYLDAGSALKTAGGQGPSPSQSVPKNSNGKGYSTLVGGAYITCPADNPNCPNLLSGTGTAPYFLKASQQNLGGSQQWVPTGIASGTYTVSGSGGADVGTFSGTIPVSSAAASFTWSNQSIANNPIPRNQPLNITWTGGDPNGFADITLIASTTQSLTPGATTPGLLVECIAPASLGSFSVPTYVLQTLPSTTSSQSSLAGEILVGPASGGVPISPAPSGLDAAYLFYHFILGVPAVWQ